MPERYYLHAADVVTGKAMYEVQMPVNGILYGGARAWRGCPRARFVVIVNGDGHRPRQACSGT